MIGKLEFKLPEEDFEFYLAANARSYHSVLFHIQHNFKKEMESYLDSRESASDAEYALLDKIMNHINELCEDNKCKME